jgi:hypothetical protein
LRGSRKSGKSISDKLGILAWKRLFFGKVRMAESFRSGDPLVWVNLQQLPEQIQILFRLIWKNFFPGSGLGRCELDVIFQDVNVLPVRILLKRKKLSDIKMCLKLTSGVPQMAKILYSWSCSENPGKRGFFIMISAKMQPADHMSALGP